MPVIECTREETRRINTEIRTEIASEKMVEDRAPKLGIAFQLTAKLFRGAAMRMKHSILYEIVRERIMPDGERAELPDEFEFLRDENDAGRLFIFWGDVIEVLPDGTEQFKPYEPLPRFLDDDELERLILYRSRRTKRREPPGVSRFADLDLSPLAPCATIPREEATP